MCRKNSPLILLLVLMLTASCSTTPSAPGNKAPLTGMVYNTEGRPVQGARVLIDGTQETVTDLNGRFVTPPLTKGAHLLLISRAGYEEQRTRMDFSSPLEVLYVRIAPFESLIKEAEDALDREARDEALDYLRRAETVFPDDPALLVLYYTVFQRSGRPEEAEEYSRRLQELGLVKEK
ncbi:carboxypeptidase-like regulatory domain-containing protein [Marispirochaeta aestuarii]|uniref:carboxypeptidase-like regulatory domain-containing protein n=1 Tax=Marispirochaeta aestuarii TaxID=1963862 RepID=UPI0029C7F7DF|nr:carboxypeptidase-like regulatory domain-containing protein [Marispirochaeta aestuarii]